MTWYTLVTRKGKTGDLPSLVDACLLHRPQWQPEERWLAELIMQATYKDNPEAAAHAVEALYSPGKRTGRPRELELFIGAVAFAARRMSITRAIIHVQKELGCRNPLANLKALKVRVSESFRRDPWRKPTRRKPAKKTFRNKI